MVASGHFLAYPIVNIGTVQCFMATAWANMNTNINKELMYPVKIDCWDVLMG